MTSPAPQTRPEARGFPGRFTCNGPRKVSFFAGLAALLALMIGAGFANMSASGAATPLETTVVRDVIIVGLLVAVVAYQFGSRLLRADAPPD